MLRPEDIEGQGETEDGGGSEDGIDADEDAGGETPGQFLRGGSATEQRSEDGERDAAVRPNCGAGGVSVDSASLLKDETGGGDVCDCCPAGTNELRLRAARTDLTEGGLASLRSVMRSLKLLLGMFVAAGFSELAGLRGRATRAYAGRTG